MTKRYREIKDRYSDVLCGVTDHQMSGDIQALLRYIDHLHHALARQAAEHLVSEAFDSFAGERGARTATH